MTTMKHLGYEFKAGQNIKIDLCSMNKGIENKYVIDDSDDVFTIMEIVDGIDFRWAKIDAHLENYMIIKGHNFTNGPVGIDLKYLLAITDRNSIEDML